MVGAWSIAGAAVIMQAFMLPQGSGFPEDSGFWKLAAPFAVIALIAFGISRFCTAGSAWRYGCLSTAIDSGSWSIGFFLLLFATGARLAWMISCKLHRRRQKTITPARAKPMVGWNV